MKKAIAFTLVAAVFFALAPLLAGVASGPVSVPTLPSAEPTDRAAGTEASDRKAPFRTQGAAGFDAAYVLPVLDQDEVQHPDLHSYLTGVLLAEMPMEFEDEALKAQAVACRTYALQADAHRRHGEAAVCTASVCCQGWRDPASVPEADLLRAEAAVSATDGMVIRWNGALINATFFSCSGGRTEDAAAVWGGDPPYLRSVDSPGEEDAAHFTDEVRLPLTQFRAVLQDANPTVRFPEALGAWVGSISYTPGGGVGHMELGGQVFTGRELRKLFSLRSTAFTLTLTEAEAVFETRGNGHRVGMSQWGAEAMARAGSDYLEILTHYYTGVTVEPFNS